MDGALAGLSGGFAVFVFGFLVGQLAEPAPGLLGGIPALSWFVPPLVSLAVVVPLASVSRALDGQPQAEGRRTVQRPVLVEVEALTADSALDLFPEEDVQESVKLALVTRRPTVSADADRMAGIYPLRPMIR